MQPKTRLGLEALSRRDMPSVATVSFNDGVITMEGTPNRDVARVDYVGGYVRAKVIAYEPGSIGVGQTMNVPAWTVDTIIFSGYAGNDDFDNDTAIPSVAEGGKGNDTFQGGSNWDWFDGGEGNDTLRGMSGLDLLMGGAGTDHLFGGDGSDSLYGEGDGDFLWGEGGKDTVNGGTGGDLVSGNYYNDLPDGYADKLIGGTGTDTFVAEAYLLGPGIANRDAPQDEEPGDTFYWP